MSVRRIFIIAGEASGDLHAAGLIRALKKLQPELEIAGWGGDMMEEAGCHIYKHYRELAFMGFVEVLANITTIFANFKSIKDQIRTFNPDSIIFIDYPGFNMRLLPWAKKSGYRTIYYISPQVWAWHKRRALTLKKYVDDMLVILPFEPDFFAQYGMEAHYVGHPLLDVIQPNQTDPSFFSEYNLNPEIPLVALLPGSRRQEISTLLPVMQQFAMSRQDLQFVVAAAPSQDLSFYQSVCPDMRGLTFIQGRTYDLLAHADFALVASGTATLETALFNVPQLVLYKGNPISYLIAKRLIRVKYISLVNLLLDRPLIKELIQDEMNLENIQGAFQSLENKEDLARIKSGYQELKSILGGDGAAERAAKYILEHG